MNKALAPLTEYRQFIVYHATPSNDRPGKTDKLPVNPNTGQLCNAQESANWTDAKNAKIAATKFGTGYGVGFVLTEHDQFFCLDIDNCLLPDGKTWSPFSLSLVGRFPGAAVEVSQSGTGLHIWGRYTGAKSPHSCRNSEHCIELYTEQRFIALGHPGAQGDASTDCTVALASVISDFFPPSCSASDTPAEWTDGGTDPADDDALIAKMLVSKSAAGVFGGKASLAARRLWRQGVFCPAMECRNRSTDPPLSRCRRHKVI